ncbi:MAG: hypothetical protein NT133_01760 [Alphaproteobacteria bacterium]|nr:hypothetical protein [Alphaproteobacteria bacterium]
MNNNATLPEPAQPAADALRCVLVAVLGCLDAVLFAAAPRFSLRRWVFITCAGPLWRQLNAWRDAMARLIARLECGVLPPVGSSPRKGRRDGAAAPHDRAQDNRRDRPARRIDPAETLGVATSRIPSPQVPFPRALGWAELRSAYRRPPPHPPPWPFAVPASAKPTPRRLVRGGLPRAPLVEGAQLPHSPGNHRRRT